MRTFIILLFINLISTQAAGQGRLEDLRKKVRKDYPQIIHLSAENLRESLKSDSTIILFDVRKQEEHNVSRIPGAIRVDPYISSSAFIKKYGESMSGKKVVFYCSVGVRSSRLAIRVGEQLRKLGASDIANLDGGIFHWHGNKFSLVNDKGSTDFVHPYSSYWGKLVKRQVLIKYSIK